MYCGPVAEVAPADVADVEPASDTDYDQVIPTQLHKLQPLNCLDLEIETQ